MSNSNKDVLVMEAKKDGKTLRVIYHNIFKHNIFNYFIILNNLQCPQKMY